MAIITYLTTITLNVNGLTASIKRHKVIEWIRKQNPCICCLQNPRHTQTESKGMETDISWKWK